MGFLSASLSFTRYRIIENVPQTLWPEIEERLKKHAFIDIDNTNDERSFGWTSFEDMLDTSWQANPAQKAEFITFALRLDTRRISPAVLNKHYQLALREEKEKNASQGKKFVARDRKKEIKEQTILKLRAKSLPIPAFFEVVWNIQNQHIYLASTNSKVRTLFEDQFTLTFELHLEPLTPFYLAQKIMGEHPQLENLKPQSFI